MKILLLSAALLFSSLILFSCKKDYLILPENQPQLNLVLEDTSCKEAWLELNSANISLPTEVILKQDDSIVQIINLNSPDTLLYVDSLLPNHTYKFQSAIQSISQSSNSLTVTTMDTTSHNFIWQTWAFGGQAGNCTLYDVSIINENDIWAVGEIYLLDTLGQLDPLPYNALHWDGNDWAIKRIQTNFRGNLITVPLTGVYAFSTTDIWMVGSLPIHGDGQNWVMFDLRTSVDPNLSLSKTWGTNSNDMYFVGNSGSIAHYQNGQWSRVESGTDLNIKDIYGAYDNQTNKYEIFAVASDGWNKKILQINDAGTTTLQDYGLSNDLHSIWFEPERRYYIVGAGIFQKHSLKDSIWTVYPPGVVTNYYSGSIDGNGINDLFVTGAFFEVVHFNGVNWSSYRDVFPAVNGTFGKVKIKANLVVMVGFKDQQAFIAVGQR